MGGDPAGIPRCPFFTRGGADVAATASVDGVVFFDGEAGCVDSDAVGKLVTVTVVGEALRDGGVAEGDAGECPALRFSWPMREPFGI